MPRCPNCGFKLTKDNIVKHRVFVYRNSKLIEQSRLLLCPCCGKVLARKDLEGDLNELGDRCDYSKDNVRS
mgnify:CR=1 FL=1